jgi:clan AA aspartic protease (TIGR02281 family)
MTRRQAGLARLLAFASALLLAGGGAAVHAEIYQWTDADGHLHFSQDLAQVPPAKRSEAMKAAAAPKQRDPLQVYSSRRASGASPAMQASGARAGGSARSSRAMRIPFQRHGTLMKVEALLNGRVRAWFYVDTGASGVSIPWSVANQLGIRVGPSTPRIRVRTANGVISEPVVKLRSVQLGPARVNELEAAVSGSMSIGLLGGAFFNNFVYQVDSSASVITLVPNARVRGGLDQSQWLQRFEAIRTPLGKLEAYIEKGGFMDESRVEELEQHRSKLQAELAALELEANQAGVPRGWRR